MSSAQPCCAKSEQLCGFCQSNTTNNTENKLAHKLDIQRHFDLQAGNSFIQEQTKRQQAIISQIDTIFQCLSKQCVFCFVHGIGQQKNHHLETCCIPAGRDLYLQTTDIVNKFRFDPGHTHYTCHLPFFYCCAKTSTECSCTFTRQTMMPLITLMTGTNSISDLKQLASTSEGTSVMDNVTVSNYTKQFIESAKELMGLYFWE